MEHTDGLVCMTQPMPIFMQSFYLTQENVLANAFTLKLMWFPKEKKIFSIPVFIHLSSEILIDYSGKGLIIKLPLYLSYYYRHYWKKLHWI